MTSGHPMTWTSFHRREEILRAVVTTADARRDGASRWTSPASPRPSATSSPCSAPSAALAHPPGRAASSAS